MKAVLIRKEVFYMKKRLILRILAAVLLLCAMLTAASCAVDEESLVPDGMQSATAYGATYRLYVPTTWSLKVLPGISGAYYNLAQQSSVSVAEYKIDETLAAELSALDEGASRIDYYFEKTVTAQIELLKTGSVHTYEEDCIATLLADANARQYHCSATVSGEETHFYYVIAEKDERFYVFSYTAADAMYERCMPDVKKMLEHFTFDRAYLPVEPNKKLPENVSVPSGMQIASSNEAEYLFFVPAAWQVNMMDTVCSATAPDGSFVSVVPFMPPAEGISVTEYFEKSEEMMKKTSGGHYTRFEEKDKEITLGGGQALQYEYEYTVGGVTYRYLQVIVGYKGMLYNLTYTALPQNFDTNYADIEAIIAAFAFR